MNRFLLAIVSLIFAAFAGAQFSDPVFAQESRDYAGQEQRKIKSLSESDIEELRNGRGWGLAKPAELNGYPGPVHLIELKDEIELTDRQLASIEALYQEMKGKAVPLGLRLIELEKALDDAFAKKSITEESLEAMLGRIEEARKDLRFTHLSAHLKTMSILTPLQIAKYNNLRGYSSEDPCANVPEGHDPGMWRKHNGCEN